MPHSLESPGERRPSAKSPKEACFQGVNRQSRKPSIDIPGCGRQRDGPQGLVGLIEGYARFCERNMKNRSSNRLSESHTATVQTSTVYRDLQKKSPTEVFRFI
jgi:hypothetical protein